MSASLGVAAFVIVVLELVAGAGAVILLRRFWRQVGPQVQPLLAMFAPAPASVPDRPEYVPPASDALCPVHGAVVSIAWHDGRRVCPFDDCHRTCTSPASTSSSSPESDTPAGSPGSGS